LISAPPVLTGAERLLRACRREPVDTTPVWFMRQAGGSLPRYLALRERYSVLEIAKTPELCAEVTAGAVEALEVDGAVLFADIMLPLEAMGVEMELTAEGPVIAHPIRSASDIPRLRPIDAAADLPFVLDAIRLVRVALDGRAAVIGLCGGPFTLAAYLIEGAPSRDQLRTRTLMHAAPEVWAALLERLTVMTEAYVRAQAEAGADVIQVFDSWAGALGPRDYARFVAPFARRVLEAVPGVPTIHFAASSSGILEPFAGAGGTVVGIDHHQSLLDAWERLGWDRAVQGNLDPAVVLAPWSVVEQEAQALLAAVGGRDGHIFNLGHAAPRDADPGLLRDLVAFVHEEGRAPRESGR
jgi:uroporphyrinogen decarboxylase